MSELLFLKIDPEEAILIIDELIVSGYELKDKIWKEYQDSSRKKEAIGKNIEIWRKELMTWSNNAIQKLDNVYISPKYLYNFRDAKPSPLVRVGVNVDFIGIENKLQARVDKLNEYTEYILQNFKLNIVAGGDVNMQLGNRSKMNIKK